MARPKNILKTITLTIATNPALVEKLESLIEGGLYGKSSAEAAERLVAKGIQELEKDGQLKPKND